MRFFFQKEKVLLLLIVVLGLVLRLWKYPDYLVFDYEKARDLIASLSIIQDNKLSLIGPTTEIEGIYQGPLYYYLLGTVYFFSGGNPGSAAVVSFGFNILGIIFIYYIGKNLFNKKIGLIAAFLYSISFESISYAYWLSNPGPSVPFIFLSFYFFYKFLSSKFNNIYLPLSLFCLGVSIQFQILNIIFLLPLIIFYFFSARPHLNIKTIFLSLTSFFIPISTFIAFEIRHDFLMTKIMVSKVIIPTFINKSDTSSLAIVEYIPKFIHETTYIFFPESRIIGAILLLIIIGTIVIKIKNNQGFVWKFLLLWIVSTLPIFFIPSRMSQSHAAFIGVSGGLIITFAYLLNILLSKWKLLFYLCAAVLLFANCYAINNYLTKADGRMFDYFQGLFLKTNFELIDYTFKDSQGAKFKIDTVTSPLLISPLWDYLFSWRGKTKYGYTQVRDNAQLGYLIIEPQLGAGEMFKKIAMDKADKEGTLVESHYFGGVYIQKRILNK